MGIKICIKCYRPLLWEDGCEMHYRLCLKCWHEFIFTGADEKCPHSYNYRVWNMFYNANMQELADKTIEEWVALDGY